MNSMIIEKLKNASVISNTGKVNLENLAEYVLTHDVLVVMYDGTVSGVAGTYLRAVIEKWTFQDKAMGEQFITFDYLSEQPVAWAVNDYCIFRGERFVLNYIPSVTQKGRRNTVLDAYKYEGVKLNSLADELTRCQMLDVVLTSGDPNQGTNYTGSSQFPLFCGETTVGGVTRTAVMTLGDRILANLNRMYTGAKAWTIVYGSDTHTEDQQLTFDNQYVSEALAMIKSKFDLNYAVKGRTIYIGCELGDVADVDYGYGPGYPTEEAGGKGLFELKKISDSSQQIVTRLRVLGSTKNLPYRYYNKAYELPQALFPLNLQLPDTFLPMTGTATHKRPGDPDNKTQGNSQRSSSLRAVKGATNDAYLDKGDDAEATPEGVREATIRFDGSDSKLKEIYPTIEDVTYDELRGSNVPDQEGTTGENAFPNYEADEKVNELLAIGYEYDGQMYDDANVGSGILSDDNGGQAGSVRDVSIPLRVEIMTHVDDYYCGTEQTLFTVSGQTAGKYFFTPVMNKEPYFSYLPLASSDPVGFIIRVKATSGGTTTVIAEYKSDFYSGKNAIVLPSIPDVFYMADAKVREIALSGTADITVTFIPCTKIATALRYRVGPRQGSSYTAQYVWNNVNTMDSSNMPFHVFVKDMGVDFEAQFNGETPAISMKSGECVGREFQISAVEKGVEYDGKKGYMLTLNRASDSSLNTYYPNSRNNISADDQFVIVGIDMPDAYIRAAEMRLLAAATEWLAENGDTNFHYQPAIDDIYLKRNYDNMVALNTAEDSVFWKLYAGYDLTFHPIPAGPSDPEPSAISVTIESVTITMGEGLTRKVDILLNDELKESTLKRVTQEVKDLNNKVQNVGSGMSTATMETTVRRIGDKQYLSKVDNDEAAGDIIFHGTIRFDKNAMFAQGAYFGENADGTFNTEIDPHGNLTTQGNMQAMGGVAAHGMATLQRGGGGGMGTVTGINVNGTLYEPSQGLITLPDYPTAASLISDGLASQSYVQSYFSDNFTQANIKSTLGIYDWALAASKPSYNFSEIGSKPTTLAGYGITDAHITSGVITLGGNTITPATLTNGKIPLSQIPDAILGQLIYGGTVNGSGVVTLSQNAMDKWGITSLTLTSTNYSTYEGAFFIASADGTSGVPSTLGLLVGDWVVATASGWGKIDNTDAVTGVKGDAESSYRIGNVNITKGNIGLGNVENTALSTWAGTSNITTLGTIATGVWHGTAIGYDYLASGVQTSLGKADTVRGYFDTNGLLNKANHYTPANDSSSDYSASATGATASWGIDVVKGVQIQRDAKGHILGVTVTSGKIPAKPTYAFSDLTSHPTTLSGYGITDGVNGLQKSGSGYLSNVGFVEGNDHSLLFTFTSFAKAQIGHTGGSGTTTYKMRVKADGAWSDYLALQQAGASAWGIVTDQAQTFGGDKTFNGNIQSMKGVAARGMATLQRSGGGGSGTVTSIKFGSASVIVADNGLLSVPVGQGTSNGQINIGGQDVSVKGLGSLAYLSSFAFTDLTNTPTTLAGYGITDAKIENGVITLGSNSITPLTGITSSMVTTALGYTPFNNASFTQANIQSTLGISNWALASSKPSYAFSEITGTASDSQIPTLAISKISGLQTALDGKLATTLKGAANGLAELDANGLVPSSQLPSYVDDVLEYSSKSAFPSTGTSGKIYVALDTNLTYRWSGTAYVEISPSLALGETSSTAYRGDRGAIAYSHATDANRLTTAQASGFYKFATTAEGHIASVTAVTASDLTSLIGSTTYAPYNANGYLPLSGGIIGSGSVDVPLNIKGISSNVALGLYAASDVKGYVNWNNTWGLCLVLGTNSERLGILNNGTPYYASSNEISSIKQIWHEGNDGSGSGLDADLLDGREATGFVKKEELPSSGQSYNANSLTNAGTYYTTTGDRSSVQAWENFPDNQTSGPFDLVCLRGENSSYPVQFFHNYGKNDFWLRFKSYFNGGVNWKDWAKIWTSANHGSGSGLDADKLDGQEGSYYATASSVTTLQGYFTDGVAKSALKLENSHTLWGQPFNGTADIGTDKYAKMPYLLFRTVTSGSDAIIGYVGRDSINNVIHLTGYSGVPVSIGTDYQDDLYITTGHKVGFGTTNPSEKLHVVGNILSSGNIVANGGVAARGMATLQGGTGTGNPVTQINVGSTAYTPSNGVVSLPAYPTWSTLSGKPSNVSAFTNDSGYITSSALAVTFTTTTLTSSSTSVYLNNTVQRDTFQKIIISSANNNQQFNIHLMGSGSYYGYHRQVLVTNDSGKSISLLLDGANYTKMGGYDVITNQGPQRTDTNPISMDDEWNREYLLDIIQANSSEYPIVKVTLLGTYAD